MTDVFVVDNLCALTLFTPGCDDLTLTGTNTDQSGNVFAIEACDEGTTWGAPIPVDTAVERWKTDGAIAQTQNDDNREITFSVILSATTPVALAAAEAALASRAQQPGTLRWTPPQGDDDAPSTDFEVWTWHLEHSFDGIDERHTRRMYQVTMTAKPWVKSTDLTTVPALVIPGSPTTTPVDACTSTSGWTGGPNAPTTSGGAVRETVALSGNQNASRAVTLQLLRTGAVTGLDTTPYLQLDMAVTGAVVNSWSVLADTVPLTKVGQVGSVSYWQMPVGVTSLTTLMVVAQGVGKVVGGTAQLAIADVSKTDTVGGVGSRKQLTRSLAVGGSVKTSGSIKVASPSTTPLGTVLVYTQPDNGMGYNPGLRQYRTAGNTQSAQATAVSGFREPLSPTVLNFGLPANVVPEASYAVVARLFATAVGTGTVSGAVGTGSAGVNAAYGANVTWAVANTYVWANLGMLSFPYLALPDESQVGSFVTMFGSGVAGLALDEVYLLDVTHGDYSLINCGATATRLSLDAPDAGSKNRPAVYLGTTDDRSDAYGADGLTQVLSLGDHDLDPEGSVLFTVTDNVNNAAVSASFYQRWHTHAAA